MAFTRFHDDPSRIIKTNLETTSMCNYTFNVPSNTNKSNVYINDPHIRLQKSGSLQYSNMVDLEGQLKQMDRSYSRDFVANQYNTKNPVNHELRKIPIYQLNKSVTDESRSTHPSWTYRSLQQYRSDYLFEDPQNHCSMKFVNNVDTNIDTKDNFRKNHKKI
uniref:Uncharacterized protein n=1 Tax=viral metagenome TaxID=1070528 RepID=A0A6C0L0S1_9ZZZZ